MPSRERIPNEIWLEIFRSLPRQNLTCIHSIHRQFAAISRQLLFAHFTFHPFEEEDVECMRDGFEAFWHD
ncbi:hypothetical protein FB45DRAFT_1021472 [Roridomyces roridus]|uniref:F-box domain-containing protein n=1 Tax=Roridomyces roridus TaxID=1738132 RepID=A0AAD7CEB1_9AGAR|nr:hypothetical protein FB45DRAFT_1021472 [Roridomyces roridus]